LVFSASRSRHVRLRCLQLAVSLTRGHVSPQSNLPCAELVKHRRLLTALLLPVLQFYDWFTLSDASIHGASGAIEALHSEVRLPIHARRLS